jgi:hypothetical protein
MEKMSAFEIKNMLTKIDLEVLHQIYLLRCLTINQIYVNFYEDTFTGVQQFKDKKVSILLQLGVVEEIYFSSDNSALFLTKTGIDVVVAEYQIPINIVDVETNGIKRGYYRASELKMLAKNIPHQVHLNQFMLDFKKIYETNNYPLAWTYYDEKYVSMYTKIRPDGLINILDTDLFLEMDMSTESKAQLIDKWKHYKSFLNSVEHRNNDKKVIVLFIVENTNLIENRKNLIKLTAQEIVLNDLDDKFEIIVGTKDELLTAIFQVIIPDIMETNYKKSQLAHALHNLGFDVVNASPLSSKLSNSDYGFFIRRLDESNNIIIENSKIQGYFIDYYIDNSVSNMAKIAYLDRNLSNFHYYYKWTPSYIVVCDDINRLHNDLKLFNLDTSNNVYYTTLERLQTMPFHEALFQFNFDGDMYSFKTNGLRDRVFI